VNVEKLLEEDQLFEGIDMPYRFGQDFEVNYTLKDGIWLEQNQERIWRLKFVSPGAFSLNFIFEELYLPSGAQLHIFNTEGSMVYGPVTSKENLTEGLFLTDLIAGDEVIIQITEPAESKEKSVLKISRVIHAYKNMYPFVIESENSRLLSCHNDVNGFPEWGIVSTSVALILLANGNAVCSGALLNNTAQDYRPFVLTGFHCIDSERFYNCTDGILSAQEIANAENWMFRFRYQSSGSNWYTYNRAYFRAASISTDFALMELRVNLNKDIALAGWDRSTAIPTKGTGIHHPLGNFQKISFDNHSLSKNTIVLGTWDDCTTSPINTHWLVGLDSGTNEGGSSGSPLFNTDKRVVGQLHGGYPFCPPVTHSYGIFRRSWYGGGTDATRLRNWLAPTPADTAILTTNTIRCPNISGQDIIYIGSNYSFYFNNPPTSFTWQLSSNLIKVSENYNTITVKPIGTGTGKISMRVNNRDVAEFEFTIKAPLPTIIGPDKVCTTETFSLSNNAHTASGWTVHPAHLVIIVSQTSTSITINRGGLLEGEPGSVVALIDNAAGGVSKSYKASCTKGDSDGLSSYIVVYPNPTSGILNIEIDAVAAQEMLPTSVRSSLSFDIRLLDIQGNLLRQATSKGGLTEFNVAALPNGTYYLHIYDGINGTPEIQQILVEH